MPLQFEDFYVCVNPQLDKLLNMCSISESSLSDACISLVRRYLVHGWVCLLLCSLASGVTGPRHDRRRSQRIYRDMWLFLGLQLGPHSLSLSPAFTKPPYSVMGSNWFHNHLPGSGSFPKHFCLWIAAELLVLKGIVIKGLLLCHLADIQLYFHYLCHGVMER